MPNALLENIERTFVQLHLAKQINIELLVRFAESTRLVEGDGQGLCCAKKGDEAVYVREVLCSVRLHLVIDLVRMDQAPQPPHPNCRTIRQMVLQHHLFPLIEYGRGQVAVIVIARDLWLVPVASVPLLVGPPLGDLFGDA